MIKDTLHLRAPGNWMNDPNGFIYFKGTYHLFYQYFPYAPVWGTMHWGHAVSQDLIHWNHLGTALYPSKAYDRNGIFSGSAIEVDEKLYLYYSAVRYLEENKENIHLSDNEQFETSQAMITSVDGIHFNHSADKRMIIPVSGDQEIADNTHTRDPKVWNYQGMYYMVLGSTTRQKGRILFYKSKDAIHWEFVTFYEDSRFGTILECPDLFEVDGQYMLVASPMGIMEDGLEYSQHAVCTVVDFEAESCRINGMGAFRFVDYGLDLYAPQTNLDAQGRRVLIAWMRMPQAVDESSESERAPWNGMMCIPRVVTINENGICFSVHPNVDKCFTKEIDKEQIDHRKPFRLKTSLSEGERVTIGGYEIQVVQDCIQTDRSKVFLELEGYRMKSVSPELFGTYELDIFVDQNLIEVFINNGQYVISNVVYNLTSEIKGHIEQIYMEQES